MPLVFSASADLLLGSCCGSGTTIGNGQKPCVALKLPGGGNYNHRYSHPPTYPWTATLMRLGHGARALAYVLALLVSERVPEDLLAGLAPFSQERVFELCRSQVIRSSVKEPYAPCLLSIRRGMQCPLLEFLKADSESLFARFQDATEAVCRTCPKQSPVRAQDGNYLPILSHR